MTTHTHFDHDLQETNINWLLLIQVIVFFGLGFRLLHLMVTGEISYYISPHFSWLTYVAGGLFVLFGILKTKDLLTGDDGHHHHHHDHHHHDHDHDEDCDHDHEHHHHDHDGHQHEDITWGIMAIISIPLLLSTLFPAVPLSADSVNGGISTTSVGVATTDIRDIPATERTIIDWLRLFESQENLTEFVGQPVDVIGFVYEQPTEDGTSFMVVRFTISCCVADALAIGLPFDTENIDIPATGSWIRIQGTLDVGLYDGEQMPIIQPENITPVDVPEDPYLYT